MAYEANLEMRVGHMSHTDRGGIFSPFKEGVYPWLNLSERSRWTGHALSSKEARERLISVYRRDRSRIDNTSGAVLYSNSTFEDRNRLWAAVVGVPIRVETETVAAIEPTFASLAEAAAKAERPTLVMPYLNYQGDLRNEGQGIQRLQARTQEMADAIVGIVSPDNNARLLITSEHVQKGITWPQLRTNMSDRALGYLEGHFNEYTGLSQKFDRIYHTPYLQVDGDTRVDEDAIQVVSDVLQDDKAVFVNGTLHYTGGIMDESPQEAALHDTNSKLLYFIEHMRRRMFDHLPHVSLRGYLPDFGLGVKLGAIYTLGGFEQRSAQNESYFLQHAAYEAVRSTWGLKQERFYPDAYIDHNTAMALEGLVYYAPYKVDSSIRGIQANVDTFGRAAVVPYDQGPHYITWTDFVTSGAKPKIEPELSIDGALPYINAAYSTFKEFGGELRIEDLHGTEERSQILASQLPKAEMMSLGELLDVLFPHSQDNVVFWRPQVIPKDQRPTISA